MTQICHPARGFVPGQITPIDRIGIGDRHQHLNRQAALVVFQQVDIRRADVQLAGHVGLGLPPLASQLAQPGADEGLGHSKPYNIT